MRPCFTYALVLGLGFGIFMASVFVGRLDAWLFVCLGVVLCVVALRTFTSPARVLVAGVGLVLLGVAIGIARTDAYTKRLSEQAEFTVGETVTVRGLVAREPDQRETTQQLYVHTARGPVLVSTDRYQLIRYGDEVEVVGVVREPASFETDLGRVFNYPGYLAARGITHTVAFAEVTVIGHEAGNQLLSMLLGVKARFLDQIEARLSEPQAGLAEGLLLGVKRAMGDELEETFRRTGIIHIVVLSGYNIMLVVTFVLYVLSFIFPWRGRLVVGLCAIAGFALLVGLSATVLRASLMAGLALVARLFGRTYLVMHALVVTGALMLLINPYLLVFDPGFQLSFLATVGLIVAAPRLETSLQAVTPMIGIREFLVATLATQLFVLPLLLYQIGEFSVVAVIVNVLVLPLVPVAMLATFLMVVCGSLIDLLAFPFSLIAYGALSYILIVPTYFASLPFAAFAVPAFPFWVVVVAYLGIALGFLYRRQPADPLPGWTIVEESALLAPDTDVTPVFFRPHR